MQKDVFHDLGRGILDSAWQGYNATLLAYGQTGSGKSYSMVGLGANKGIIPNVCEELFQAIEERERNQEYQVCTLLKSLLGGISSLILEIPGPELSASLLGDNVNFP